MKTRQPAGAIQINLRGAFPFLYKSALFPPDGYPLPDKSFTPRRLLCQD